MDARVQLGAQKEIEKKRSLKSTDFRRKKNKRNETTTRISENVHERPSRKSPSPHTQHPHLTIPFHPTHKPETQSNTPQKPTPPTQHNTHSSQQSPTGPSQQWAPIPSSKVQRQERTRRRGGACARLFPRWCHWCCCLRRCWGRRY